MRCLVLAGAQAATPDVLLVRFKNRSLQSENPRGLAKIIGAKSVECFLNRPHPTLTTNIAPDFRVGMHLHKIGLIRKLMGAEQQALCFQKNHSLGNH